MTATLKLLRASPTPRIPIPDAPSDSWLAEPGPVGVDEKAGPAGTIHGCVVAQAGPFKSEGRGRFDESSLDRIIQLWPTAGLKSHAQHGHVFDDRLLGFLGRMVSPRRSLALIQDGHGQQVATPCVRANLVFDPSARKAPGGDLVTYFTARAKSDPDSLSSSLVLETDTDEDWHPSVRSGNGQPPLWLPTALHGVDIVSIGDAVGALLGTGIRGRALGLRVLSALRPATSRQSTKPSAGPAIRGLCLPVGIPFFDHGAQEMRVLCPEAVRESGFAFVPITHGDDDIGDGATFELRADGLHVSVRASAGTADFVRRGEAALRADYKVIGAETRFYRGPGRWHGHRLTHVMAIRPQRICLTVARDGDALAVLE